MQGTCEKKASPFVIMIYVFGLLWAIFNLGLMAIAAVVEGIGQDIDNAEDDGKDDVPVKYLQEGKGIDSGQ